MVSLVMQVHVKRLNVFGRPFVAEHTEAGWRVHAAGADGKRGASLVPSVPTFVHTEDELVAFLADLFHESATPERSEVHWVP